MNRKLNEHGLVIATVGWVLGFAAGGPAARAGWEVVGAGGFSAGAGDYTSLAFYNGEPYVAFRDLGIGDKGTVKRYTGGSWQTVGTGAFSAGAPYDIDLVFYDGEPYVVYTDATNGLKATVKRCTGGSWQTVGAGGLSVSDAHNPSLAFENGEPYVAYQDVANGSRATVRRYTGGSWQTVGTAGFSADMAVYTSLAFSNDEPYVAYQDVANGSRATVRRYTGGSWQTVGAAGFSTGTADETSLAFLDGDPYVAFTDGAHSFKATVMRYTGGSWQTVGAAGFSADEAYYNALAFYNGEPYLAYQDIGLGGKATVKRYTGGSWQTVGTAGFSAGASYCNALAFCYGEPYLAYVDDSNGGKATVMRYSAPPTIQATNITFSNVSVTEATIGWTRGGGGAGAVFIKQASSGTAAPADNTTYAAGAAWATGTQIGATGWYCICNGAGTTVTVTGLSASTTYRVMVCEYNGPAGSEQYSTDAAADNPANVTTDTTPTVTTAAVSDLTTTTAMCGGSVTDDGGASVTARGLCWSTSANPTTADSQTSTGTGTGAFVTSLSGLEPGTTYHVRAYATNAVGTAYGNDVQFGTPTAPSLLPTPTVTTAPITERLTSGATGGGQVVTDGGWAVTARGVCWSTTAEPMITDNKTIDGAGTGAFVSRITGLHPGTDYHVRAYATNRAGTSYGREESFSTLPDADGDGVTDAEDGCPHDPSKIELGMCGCGTPDADTDRDDVPDCRDACANDPGKISPGVCGCGTPDTDTDRDDTPDCHDGCPNDPGRTAPGSDGCGGDPDNGLSILQIEVTQVPSEGGDGDAGAAAGDELVFVVAIDNTGAGPAGHVVITVTMPLGLEFVSARALPPDAGQSVPENIRVENGQVLVDAGDLEPGARVRVELVFRSTAGGVADLHIVAQTTEADGPAVVQQEVVVQVDNEDRQESTTRQPHGLCGAGSPLPLLGLSLLLAAQGMLRRGPGGTRGCRW